MVEARFDAEAATPEARRVLHEQNRLSWNEATRAHNSHKAGQARFFREGGNQLTPEEAALLGDLTGMSVVHLQCNSGQDTLSMKRLGAAQLLGVDISDEAVGFARQLSAHSGIPASFVRADVYDWLASAARDDARWDVVFCSFGAIIWLSDLGAWAKGIAAILRPGGRFVTVEFHPVEMMFDPERRHWMVEGVQGFLNRQPSHEFHWATSEVVSAFLDAGLALEHFREYDYCRGFRPFKEMKDLGERRFAVPDGMPSIPLMYSLVARKPA
jgi:SAM-dependent methyltransferase